MVFPYIQQLVDRMLDTSDQDMVPGYDSSKTISWAALREAEILTDSKFIDNIIEHIESEKNKKRRNYMYIITYRICEKQHYQKGLEFLIDRIDKETDKYIISALLDGLLHLHKSAETNLDKIFEAINHKTWQVRFSAIKALCNSYNSEVEDKMISLLKSETTTKQELSNAITVCYNCGTPKCIPELEKHLLNKSRNIKSEAKETIKYLTERVKKTKFLY